ncbi:MAG: hypothetical protein ACP5IO_06470 [Elusimicrobiales bacterium]
MNRKNALIFIVMSPAMETVDYEIKKSFGIERAVNITRDVTIKTYSNIKSDSDYMMMISYFFTKKFPDLRWLDPYEPGYLDVSNLSYGNALIKSIEYAFKTGADKAVWVNSLCPFVDKNDVINAFSNIGEKQVVLGHAANGGLYMAGVSPHTYTVLSVNSVVSDLSFDETVERIRRNKFVVFELEPRFIIKDDDSLKKWVESPDFTIKSSSSESKARKKHKETQNPETHQENQPPQNSGV